jgi:hypothetical protein
MEIAALLNRPHAAQERRPVPAPLPPSPSHLLPEPAVDFPDAESVRSSPYTLHDDLSIFKVVAAYYGFDFHGKIPWSFWQTYKRVTHSTRSNSSLYHHWNGAMKKRYEPFLATGRISDCILWLETAAMAEQMPSTQLAMPTGAPLCHFRSEPAVALPQPPQPPDGRALVRTSSHRPEPCDPLMRMPDVMKP